MRPGETLGASAFALRVADSAPQIVLDRLALNFRRGDLGTRAGAAARARFWARMHPAAPL